MFRILKFRYYVGVATPDACAPFEVTFSATTELLDPTNTEHTESATT